MNIMISYRRADSGPITGRIYDRLRAHFGPDHVFIDIDSIPMGIDYRNHISNTVTHCDVLLPVIGPRWTGPGDAGDRRIDDPSDLVRLEVAHALERNIRVIPLLIENARMPSNAELPDDLKPLTFRNALKVDSGIDFHHHIDRLCAAIEAAVRESGKTVAKPSAPTAPAALPDQLRSAGNQILALVREASVQLTSALSRGRLLFGRAKSTKWFLPALCVAGLLLVTFFVFRYAVRKSPRTVQATSIAQNVPKPVARVPDARQFAVGSAEAQLVGTWKQGDVEFIFYEDGNFETKDPARGGDEGRWQISGIHVTAIGNHSHPTRTWKFNLSSDKTKLPGNMVDEWGHRQPLTLRRQ